MSEMASLFVFHVSFISLPSLYPSF